MYMNEAVATPFDANNDTGYSFIKRRIAASDDIDAGLFKAVIVETL